MATVATDHYRAYAPRPFTRAERDSTTILFGGLHWRIERILQAVLEGSGYRAQILPVATKEDLLTGVFITGSELQRSSPINPWSSGKREC